MSTVRVVLRDDVAGLGSRGDIVEVAPGYARNYLVPHGLAMRSTPGSELQANAMRRARVMRDTKNREAATEIATVLVPKIIAISARASGEGKLFGSVSSADIVAAVQEQTGIELDRRVIVNDEHIKETGHHMVMARLHSDVEFPIQLDISAA